MPVNTRISLFSRIALHYPHKLLIVLSAACSNHTSRRPPSNRIPEVEILTFADCVLIDVKVVPRVGNATRPSKYRYVSRLNQGILSVVVTHTPSLILPRFNVCTSLIIHRIFPVI